MGEVFFSDYAEDKLKLMKFLKLSEKEKIEMLADGVREPSVRRLVLNTRVETVPDFIGHVRRITEDSMPFKQHENTGNRSWATRKDNTTGVKECSFCKRLGHLERDCRRKGVPTYYRCGQQGHIATWCTKTAVKPVATSTNCPAQERTEPSSSNVHAIEKGTPFVAVSRGNNQGKVFQALVDTGSPVSLVRKSVFAEFFENCRLLRVKENLNLKGLNNTVISVYGKIFDQISLLKLSEQWFDICLLVVDDDTIAFDILLGRNFFNEANIQVTFRNNNFEFKCIPEVLKENNILSIYAIEKKDRDDVILEKLDENLKHESKIQLMKVIHEIDNLKVEPIKDDYSIRVHLKDSSLYRFASRRMSFKEK
ncbi:hypothetical protein EUZ93_01520 [Wolbachia pipientis]|nr:hypothetical protein [Wolbachia pipientis]